MEPESTTNSSPREHNLPSGDIAVSSHWVHGIRDATTVVAEDEPLYRLLLDILEGEHIPTLMPARLASACDDLVDVRSAVDNIDRGSATIGGVSWGMGYCYRVKGAIAEYRDREPWTLTAVGCSGSKHTDDAPMPARERYKGSYWSGKRGYGETCADEWQIISAEFALLNPDTPIDYYERTPDDLEGVPVHSEQRLPNGDSVDTLLDQWALDVYNQLAGWLQSATNTVDPFDVELEVLLGRSYRDPLEARGVFDALRTPGDLSVSFPFQDEPDAQGGMIPQIGWMSNQVEAATEAVTDGGVRSQDMSKEDESDAE